MCSILLSCLRFYFTVVCFQGSKGSPALVASYGGDSEDEDGGASLGGEEDGVNDEEKMLNWTKIACLLCKRQFQAKEALQRHVQLSDLHKKNLEDMRRKNGSGGVSFEVAVCASL
jgi:RNA-binding protein 5/10